MSTPEGKIKDNFKKRLSLLKRVYRFMPVQNGMGMPALDFYLCVNGFFVGVEAKKDAKTKPTPRQDLTAEQITAAGGFCFVIYDEASIDVCINSMKRLIEGFT